MIGLDDTKTTPSPYFAAASFISFSEKKLGRLALLGAGRGVAEPAGHVGKLAAAAALMLRVCSMVPLPSGRSLMLVSAVMQPEVIAASSRTLERRTSARMEWTP